MYIYIYSLYILYNPISKSSRLLVATSHPRPARTTWTGATWGKRCAPVTGEGTVKRTF